MQTRIVAVLILLCSGGCMAGQGPYHAGRAMTFPPTHTFAVKQGRGYRPNLQAYENLAPYRIIWSSAYLRFQNRPVYNRLKKQGCILLVYWSSCTSMAKGHYLPYNIIEKNNWWLRDAQGRKIPWSRKPGGKYTRRYYIDITNTAFQDWAVKWLVDNIADFSGIGFDNVVIGKQRCRFLPPAMDRTVWELGFVQYLDKLARQLHDKNRILIINHSAEYRRSDFDYWEELVSAVDGLMSELPVSYKRSTVRLFTGADLQEALSIHREILAAGKIDWWVWYDRRTVRTVFGYWRQIYRDGLSFFCGWDLVKAREYVDIWSNNGPS